MSNFWSGSQRILDSGEQTIANYVYDTNTLSWVAQSASGGSGPSSDVNVTNTSLAVTQAGTWTVGLSTGSNTIGAVNVNGTVPVSAASLPLPTGAATETTLSSLNTKTPSLGQTTMAGSQPVVIASNQSAVPVSGTFWQTTQPVSIAATVAVTKTKVALTPSSPATASVGTSSAQAVASNASRKGLVITNLSNNRVSLGLAATAVLNSGITLVPNGTFVMDDYTFVTGAINAIASASSSTISIQEFT